MKTDVRFDLRGMKSLEKRIQKIPEQLQKRAFISVIGAGARLVAKEAKSRIPKGPNKGLLKKSIGTKQMVFGRPPRATPYAVIGSRTSVKGAPKTVIDRKTGQPKTVTPHPAKYAHLVEYGTVRSAARPFMRPALDAASGKIVNIMAAMLDKWMTKEVAKLKAKGKL